MNHAMTTRKEKPSIRTYDFLNSRGSTSWRSTISIALKKYQYSSWT